MDINAKCKDMQLLETIYAGVVEQQVEMDYLLADYCPNIYKVLKCSVRPVVVSKRIGNEKLIADLNVVVKVLYLTENSKKIYCVEQKQIYTKEIDIAGIDDTCIINLAVKCDFCNLRVVNPRRLDLKGAVTIKAIVTKPVKVKIMDNVSGDNCNVKTSNKNVCSSSLYFTKESTINEDVLLSQGKPPITAILHTHAAATVSDYKIMKNKALVKGNINLHILYCSDNSQQDENNVLEYVMPFSQIIDMNGIDDEHKLLINVCVIGVDVDFSKISDENKNIVIATSLCFECYATKNAQIEVVEDMYSTDFECTIVKQDLKPSVFTETIDYTFVSKNNLQIPNVTISGICDIMSDVSLPTSKITDSSINIMFNQNICVLAYDETGTPIQFEKSIPCEISLSNAVGTEKIKFNPSVTVIGCSYTLLSENQIEIRTEINISGIVYSDVQCNPVVSCDLDTSRPKGIQDNGAVCLYYAGSGEDVWGIAKHFNTSVDAIVEENLLDDSVIRSKQMILIPLKR